MDRERKRKKTLTKVDSKNIEQLKVLSLALICLIEEKKEKLDLFLNNI